ncbi:sensor histidine kinase [Fundidesulfovibrio agrisoli]|uniref:sensor histidine kinase n=1 Tax=Fundidesulfovibrio agrisoli TaxID=2922717 RepID=UPI001FABF10A|nr:HAMP domain-containing sensor histidine kinase [Fundidesulfovibrio agrisoli]
MRDSRRTTEQLSTDLARTRARLAACAARCRAGSRDRARLAQLAEFVLNNPSPVLRAGMDGGIQRLNPAAKRVLGQGALGASVFDVLPGLEAAVLERRGEWAPLCVEAGFGGRWYAFHVVRAEAGDALYIYGNDITQRRQAEDTLRLTQEVLARSEALLNQTERLAQVGGWEFDLLTGEITWTRELYNIFGVDSAVYDQGDYKRNFDFVDAAWKPSLENAFEILIADGTPFDLELPITTGDGRRRWVRATAEAWRSGGRVARVYGNIKDITELKQFEQFREDVERIIRHDIKTPLCGLLSLAELVVARGVSERSLQLFPDLVRAVRHVMDIVDSSEKICRMEKGDYVLRATWFELGAVVERLSETLAPLFSRKGCRLVRNAPPESVMIRGEEFLVADMLSNLVRNAVEASPEGGEVAVSWGAGPGGAFMRIHNIGTVPEAVRERFFEKYVTSGKSQGTGLGTYSARLVAVAHGGTIGFSSSEAEGTTVEVTLPVPAEGRPAR